MPRFELTRGAVANVKANRKEICPCDLQVTQIKEIRSGDSNPKWRIVLSDGTHWIQGVLSEQTHDLAARLNENSVIRVTDFMCNNIQGRSVAIILGAELLGECERIGKPMPIAPTEKPNGQNAPGARPARNIGGNSGSKRRSADDFQPVTSLNPYQSGWRIKVRCTAKDPVRHYRNAKGDGKVFSIDLLDRQGGEIRCTMFNSAVDKFYGVFEKDRVYVISRGSVKISRKQWTHIKNDYAITLDDRSEVTPVNDDDASILKMRYNFVTLGSVTNVRPGEFVDVIGVVDSVSELSSVRSKTTQREIPKRNLVIADKTARIDVTLWDALAQANDESVLTPGTVVALKACKVSDFGGRSLSSGQTIEVSPTRQEATDLRQWFDSVGGDMSRVGKITARVDSSTPRLCIEEVEFQGLGKSEEKREYFSVKGTITAISHSQDRPPWYTAAPTEDSKAKVEDDGFGNWMCSKTGKVYKSYIPRYIMRFAINDHSGSLWVNAFNDMAELVLGVPAKEAERCLNENPKQYEQIFKDACFKTMLFKIGARTQVYMDEPRVRYEVMGISDVSVDTETEFLESELKALEADFPGI